MAAFNIKYNAMDQLYISAGKRISEWNKELDSWSKSYNQVVSMETFQGVSATGAKTYLAEVHGVLIYAIQQAFASYMSRLLLYKQGYHDIDSSLYASLPETKMKELSNRLSHEASELDGISRDVNSSLNSISDIIYLSNPSKDYLQSNLEGLKKDIDSFSDRISNYESSQYNSANGDLKSLIDALERTVKECYNSGANIASYTSGSIAHSSNIAELFNSVDKENEYIKENAESIKIAGDKQTADFEQMQKDYEAACKAREEQGAEKIIKGIIGVGLGVGAIILTAGAAAPLVVTVAVCGAGGCSAAFGLSSGTEGVQDVCHGFTGNLSAHSFNPIRDTIFCGNQSAYDTWGNISMTISSFAIPAGKVLSSGATGLQAVKLYGTEIAKDFTIGYGSSKITGYASDMLHLNGVESLGLNLMLNMGLYKATSFAGSKLAGLKTKADVPALTEDDIRYNQRWDDLAAGKDLSHPGMSDIEYQKWISGDLKVQEQLALNKVNPEEINALRKENIKWQNEFLGGKVKSTAEVYTADSVKNIIKSKGYSVDEFVKLLDPDRVLTDSEKEIVKSVRSEIGLPTSDTLMCKVIPQRDIESYLNGSYKAVRGFTSIDKHGSKLKTLYERFDGARLDYNKTPFNVMDKHGNILGSAGIPDKYYATIQYKANDVGKISIPSWEPGPNEYPYTGRGLTGSKNVALPEFFQQDRPFANGDILNVVDSNTGKIVKKYSFDIVKEKWIIFGGK